MQFDTLRQQAFADKHVSVPSEWSQGRTVFGGLSAALLAEHLSSPADASRRLRYLEVGFVRQLLPEQPCQLQREDITDGKTVAVRSGQIVQDDQVRVTAQANFIRALDSKLIVDPFEAPPFPHWDEPSLIRIDGPGAPAFTQFIDFRLATPGIPFSGKGCAAMGGWMRFKTPPDRLDTIHLIALIDAWPPVTSSYCEGPVPMSSINWQMHFAEPVDGLAGDSFLGYRAQTNFFRDGYGSSSAEVWAPDGSLLAKSFQTFVVFG
jgi:acyl-CoA thioesterase